MEILAAEVTCDGLPPDAEVVELVYQDAVSRSFVASVVIATENPDVEVAALLRTPASVTLTPTNGEPGLCVHGLIEAASYLAAGAHLHHYRLVLRPILQGLAHRVRSRLFLGEHTGQIVKKILKGAGIPDEAVVWDVSDAELAEACPVRELCIQYKESELAFVSRLLEDEGLFYWFAHTPDGHVCHIGYRQETFPAMAGEPLLQSTAELHAGQESLSDLVMSMAVTPDAYATRDWFFDAPKAPAEATEPLVETPHLELYEYPGALPKPEAGALRASHRAVAGAVPGRLLRAVSNCPRLAAGHTFTVAGAAWPSFDGDFLVLEARHTFQGPSSFSSAGDESASSYRCHIEAMPAATPFRPARRTPKPQVWGLESAVVTAPAGEEIHVDELGRIKVHFYWDRENKVDDRASTYLRVQQQNTSGSLLLPRVGWEMSVGFLDGDPDRPVALQKMYNRETMPPYGMPDNKTQSSLQSATSPGGGSTNEIRMQDGSGGMEFFVHASKDFSLSAGNDLSETIAVDVHEEVGLSLVTKVGTDEKVTIGSTHSLSVTGEVTETTVGPKNEHIGAVEDWGITKDLSWTNGGNRRETIGGLMNVLANQVVETYNANYERNVGALITHTTPSAFTEAVAGSKTETVGAAKIEIIAKAKAETIKGSKMLTSGLLHEKTGKDIGVSASSALAITVGGPIAETIDGDYLLAGGAVVITAPGGADLAAGGSTLKAKGGKLTIDASSIGANGGPRLTLKGRIDYKD